MTFDYASVEYCLVTARRAQLMGLSPNRHYGYYVLSSVVLPGARNRIHAWCATKQIALRKIADEQMYIEKGYIACKCGCGKQQRACCGVKKAS